MNDWAYAQTNPAEQLARVHYFSMMKVQPDGEFEFLITVKEFITPKDPAMLFFAEADKQTNQQVAPYTPCGWGSTMLAALAECVKAINRFPYHAPESQTARV
jgi:hypothetical protein